MAANPPTPPRLIGPRMAVWGYFPFDGRVIDATGTHADWAWAMSQWTRVALAGGAVRLVVADQPYSRFDVGTALGDGRRNDARQKFTVCRAFEQQVFGRVYVAGGRLGLGTVGTLLDDPLKPGRKVPAVAEQIDAWRRLYGDRIDGIYLDSGPRDCTDPANSLHVPGIPANYESYAQAVRQLGYKLFVQVAQYPDNQPGKAWVRGLGADFLELWEAGVLPYNSQFRARDACRPNVDPGVPSWWTPGPSLRWGMVHVINDCLDAATMQSVAKKAIAERAAGTVWITTSRQDPNLGAVFDVLPPYWDEEVAFFRAFVLKEEKDAKDAKDAKDDKEGKEAKEAKEDKEYKDDKDAKDDKEAKEAKDDKDNPDHLKYEKDTKDDKDDPDASKYTKDSKDDKDWKDDKDIPDYHKDLKDEKEEKERKDGKDQIFEKEGETFLKGLQVTGLTDHPEDEPALEAPEGEPLPLGRTFIRPLERPEVGAAVVADPVVSTDPADPERSRP
ncbi:hypothetical protein AB0B78_33905 [Streptomyces sp. NPDC040724]|uniref:hypothetical protein n=1 Tax=Streptomyces sp. NPDC040724 TaxID=3155612 RepID=UPI0033D83A8F